MVDESEFTARLAAYIHATHNAFSDNTERAFRADLAVFRNWCVARRTTAFPASPEIIADFIDDMAASRAPATVRRYVASIAVAQRVIGSDGTLGSPLVKLALQRMHRRRGRRQNQALGLTWSLRQRLLDASGNRLIDARNRALLAVAYDAMLRRSELSAARVADLVLDIHGGATLLVRRGKTDADGRKRGRSRPRRGEMDVSPQPDQRRSTVRPVASSPADLATARERFPPSRLRAPNTGDDHAVRRHG